MRDVVESLLAAGVLVCPYRGKLGPWGHAGVGVVLDIEEARRLWPRRARCRACGAAPVPLPAVVLPSAVVWARRTAREWQAAEKGRPRHDAGVGVAWKDPDRAGLRPG